MNFDAAKITMKFQIIHSLKIIENPSIGFQNADNFCFTFKKLFRRSSFFFIYSLIWFYVFLSIYKKPRFLRSDPGFLSEISISGSKFS